MRLSHFARNLELAVLRGPVRRAGRVTRDFQVTWRPSDSATNHIKPSNDSRPAASSLLAAAPVRLLNLLKMPMPTNSQGYYARFNKERTAHAGYRTPISRPVDNLREFCGSRS